MGAEATNLMNQFDHPVEDLIRGRTSWRSYSGEILSETRLSEMEHRLANNMAGPFGSFARFRILSASAREPDAIRGLGTYGFVHGMTAFLAGSIDRETEFHLEDYGYLMELNILHATDLDFQTCWLGGSFRRSRFAAQLQLREDEVIPAVSPLGFASDKRGFVDRVIRKVNRSTGRLPFEDLFVDIPDPVIEKSRNVLEAVRRAPSASNKQPWRIRFDENRNSFDFFMIRTPGYLEQGNRFGTCDLQRVDMGIGLAHFELTAPAQGLKGGWKQDTDVARGSLPRSAEYLVSWILL